MQSITCSWQLVYHVHTLLLHRGIIAYSMSNWVSLHKIRLCEHKTKLTLYCKTAHHKPQSVKATKHFLVIGFLIYVPQTLYTWKFLHKQYAVCSSLFHACTNDWSTLATAILSLTNHKSFKIKMLFSQWITQNNFLHRTLTIIWNILKTHTL